MNVFTYLKKVVILAFFIPVFSIPLQSQCGQPDGTIIVNSTADEGIGTLRDAINCANIFDGPNRIIFNISSNDRAIIQVGSTSGEPLPSIINGNTVIDGTTQPGFGVNGNFEPKIVLDGSIPVWNAPINAIKIFGANTEIYGLEIRNFPDDGIDIENAENVIIGDEEKGNVIYNCGIAQDFFPDTGNQGPYNGVGIVVTGDSDNAEISNNIIGTDYARTPNLGNEWAGIYVRNGADFVLIEGNILTYQEIGVRIRNAFGIQISENEMSCNTTTGIQFVAGGNDDKVAPVINSATNTQITGTGSSGNEIEVFIAQDCGSSPCQGTFFLGRTTVLNNGTWVLNAPFASTITGGENITATATDNNDRTSTFSDCQTAAVVANCADGNGIILVTNTNDEGPGSFRAAIDCANDTPGPNTIRFNIPGGGIKQINVAATTGEELPFLRDPGTIIDATTQPGYGIGGNYQPQIILDGSQHDWRFPHNALWVRADNCEIYGLEVRNFPDDGIDVTGADFTIIGAPNKGNVVYNCGAEKDIFEDDPNQRSWNGCGIVLKNGAQNATIQGNIIGTDYSQTSTIGNELCGIILQRDGNNNLIGGTAPGEGNLIAYNQIGVSVLAGAFNNQILGNSFYCNENNGIELSSDGNNQQAAPSINVASISVINGTGNNGEAIEVYLISNNCPDGPCQGNTLVGRATVINNSWRIDAPFLNGVTLQGGDQITAIATSTTGNTSAFGNCFTLSGINPPPPECSINLGISNFNNETCAGNDGSFTLSAVNATAPIIYDFGNGNTQTPIFSNLSAGSYNVTATDALGCSASLSVTITQEPTPTLSLVATNNENCSSADGSFTVLASGGQGPYIYELDNDRISRLPTFSDLAAGTYSVAVIDANNCSATLTVGIQRTGSINVAIADMRGDNCNTASGSFRIAASGGRAPYSYNLGNGAVTTNEFTGLSAGNYAVTVADADNCSTVANINISGGSAPVTSIEDVVQTTCSQSTGSVSISVAGGAAPFQFNIGNGNVSTSSFSNLSAGNYIITVTDANSCTSTQSITINEPASPALSIISTQNAACGNANGAVSVISSGGQAPYTYDIGWGITTNPNFNSLSEGDYNITVYDANNCSDQMAVSIENSPIPTVEVANMQDASCNLNNAILTVTGTGVAPFSYDIGNGPTTNPTFNSLAAGTYTVTMTDNNGCTANTTIEIESTGGPQINVQNTSEARCDRENGSFSVSAFGGFPPYTYDIGNGPTDQPEFSGLAGGNYVVTLTDGNGCSATQSITLGNLPAPTFGIGNIIDASCGEENGGFNVSAFGGLAPYQFSIGGASSDDPVFTELAAGTYTVVVTDANSCITSLAVTVEGTEAPEIEVTNEKTANCGVADGGFDLQVSGGVAPYFFDLGTGESTNSSFQNLRPGNYDVTITDASSCSQIKTIEVKGSTEISLAVSDLLPAACGAANGTFTLSPTGGQGPYTYTINDQDHSGPDFKDLSAGNYEVKAIDANGCFAAQTIEVTESTGPSVEVEVLANCGEVSAVINVMATQGQAPYKYDLGTGPIDLPTFRDVSAGLYQLKVTDAMGCVSTKNLVVTTSNEAPEAIIDVTKQPDCNTTNGSININVTKGRPPYLYAMSETEKSPFNTFSDLGAGTYSITVTDAGGCETTIPVSLGGDGDNPLAAFDLSFDDLNGSFTNMTQNGTTYNWDFGDGNTSTSTNTSHSFASEGTYTICLTATNDCGTDRYCENYTIEALNTNKSFEFDFGEVKGAVGDIVKVPVYVKNFKATVGFQKSVHLEDKTAAKIVGISDITLQGLSLGLFNIAEDQYSVSWFDGNIEGFDLPDSTIIYQIEIELLTDDACTKITIEQEPLPTQVYKKVGSTEVEVESFKRTGSVCSGDGGTGGQTAKISGLIQTEDGMNISKVSMSCTNTDGLTNEADGTYQFNDLTAPYKYDITPTKDINPLNGVTTIDLVLIQTHILGRTLLDSPYKLIAADVNKSGTVTVSDILELRKLLLSDIPKFTKSNSWRFIPKTYTFPNPLNPFADTFPTSASINLSNKDLTADFIGLKVGDVNGSATPNNLLSSDSRTKGEGTLILTTEDLHLEKGEATTISFKGSQLSEILGLQYTLQVDQNRLSIEEVITNANFKSNNIGKRFKEKGYLLTSWDNVKASPIQEEKLFSIKIKAKQAGNISDLIQINSAILSAEAYHKNGKLMKIQLEFIKNQPFSDNNLVLSQNQPNPFSESTVINYQLPKNGLVTLSIFDIQGRLLNTSTENGKKGWNSWELQRVNLPKGGIYYYQMNTPFGQATRKMIVIDK